jgi:hypothetical protein
LVLLPSSLLQQIYRDYYQAYFSTENYPKVIEYADKLVALGDTVDIDSRMLALVLCAGWKALNSANLSGWVCC